MAWALALLALAASLALYLPWASVLAVASGLTALAALPARPLRGGWLDPLAFALLGTATAWAAYGTVPGYFWLNRPRLAALAGALAEAPAVTSLSLGQDGRVAPGRGPPDFDSYRFLNGVLVTHYAARAKPDGAQPVIPIGDQLRAMGLPRARYDALRRLMARAGIGDAARDPASGVVSLARIGEDNEWDVSYVFSPGDRQDGTGLPAAWLRERLAPHWFLARNP